MPGAECNESGPGGGWYGGRQPPVPSGARRAERPKESPDGPWGGAFQPGRSREARIASVAPPPMAPDRQLYFRLVLGEELLHLGVGHTQVAEDALIEDAGRPARSRPLAQHGLDHRGPEKRALLPRRAHAAHALIFERSAPRPPSLSSFFQTSTTLPTAANISPVRRRYICCPMERTLLVKM